MNKKLIAVAVASVVAAPATSLADGDVTLYGRINNAIAITSSDAPAPDDGGTDLNGVASRLGVKYSKDLGNGLTVKARYEFQTNTDKRADGIFRTRIGTVGLSGAFGSVDIGNQWSAYFNTVGTLISPTYTLGGAVTGIPFRASNTIQYSNTFGPVGLYVDLRLNDSDESGTDGLGGGGVGFGVNIPIGQRFHIALATDSEDGPEDANADEDRTGIALNGKFGPVEVTLGTHSHETGEAGAENHVDNSGTLLFVAGNVGENNRWLVGSTTNDDANSDTGADDQSAITLGWYYTLGGGMRLWYESKMQTEEEGNEEYDSSTHLFGMRVDF